MAIEARHRRRFPVLLLALAAVPAALLAQTFTVTSGMPVRIEILVTCSVSAADLDFGAYNPDQAIPARGQTTIELRCAPDTSAEIALDGGSTPGGGRSRKLRQESGVDRLDYDLYKDALRTERWAEGRDALDVVTIGPLHAVTVYGEIPAGQRARDGTYSDTVTVTVTY